VPPPAKPLPVFLFATAVLVAVCVPLGLLLLNAAHETWQHGELLLTRSRPVPRLITQESNGVEFLLRCAFPAAGGLSSFLFAVIVVAVAAHRVHAHQVVAATGAYAWPRLAVRASVVPLAFFLLWLGLRIGLPLVFP
jgi:hypothetical protein